jgi:hypothetical protein
MFGSQRARRETDGFYPSSLSLPIYFHVTRYNETVVKNVTYLLLCVFKTPTPIPVLFVNLLMDFDASVPIDQTEPLLTAERTSAHGSSWANI